MFERNDYDRDVIKGTWAATWAELHKGRGIGENISIKIHSYSFKVQW
jgi:hypothetical protein